MKTVPKSLANDILIPLGLTAAKSATEVTIQKTIFRSGMTALIISNEEMEDIMKRVNSFKESSLRIKDISEKTKNEAKERKVDFLVYYSLSEGVTRGSDGVS